MGSPREKNPAGAGQIIVGKRNTRITSRGVSFVYYLLILLVALNVLVVYAAFFLPSGIMGYRQKHRQVKELEVVNDRLRLKNHLLYQKIRKAKTDPRSQERLVREHLGWVKGDKEIVVEFSSSQSP